MVEDIPLGTAPSNNPRQHPSGMQDPISGSLTAPPYAPYFATNRPTTFPPNGEWNMAESEWTVAESPYDPPYGKWVRAPPPLSFLAAAYGLPLPNYDPDMPPLRMRQPTSPPPKLSPFMMPAPPPSPPYASQFAASPSSSRMTAPPPPPYVSRSAAPPKFDPASEHRGLHSWCNGPFDAIGMYGCRGKRQAQVLLFKDICTSPQNIKSVQKICVRESGASALQVKSFGIMWVALHGMDSMCVVARNCDLEQEVLSHGEKCDTRRILRSIWNVIVSEVEAIGGPSGEAFTDSSVEPFGVVCEISGNNEVQKASSVQYDANKAIKFLQEELKTGSAFTFEKTVMTAISAFQHLFCQKFEADEIRVFAWKKGYVIGEELQQEREDPDVEEVLASLNGSDNDTDTE